MSRMIKKKPAKNGPGKNTTPSSKPSHSLSNSILPKDMITYERHSTWHYLVLQQARNSTVRLTVRSVCYATTLLTELAICHHVSYKIAELTFKALRVDLSPTYLQQCVQVYMPARSLCSVHSYNLVQNRSHTVAGDCTFVPASKWQRSDDCAYKERRLLLLAVISK